MILGYEANIGLIYYGPKRSWAEMVMGRNGHGPKWLWAEMTRNYSSACLRKERGNLHFNISHTAEIFFTVDLNPS